jgi:hypothetical protein
MSTLKFCLELELELELQLELQLALDMQTHKKIYSYKCLEKKYQKNDKEIKTTIKEINTNRKILTQPLPNIKLHPLSNIKLRPAKQ